MPYCGSCLSMGPRAPAAIGSQSAQRRSHEVSHVKISARNQIPGKLVEVTKGQTTAHVRIDIGAAIVTSSITNEAVDDLGLTVGDNVVVIVKASDVMIGK